MKSLLLLPLIIAASLAAQTPPKPLDCTASAVHRQFDFWLGEWEVTDIPSGGKAGTSKVTSILKRCVLLEEWSGTRGANGKSFNFVNQATGQWEQQWVTDTGGIIHFAGGLRGRAMVVTGESVSPAGQKTMSRMTFTPEEAGTVRQTGESSTDGGKTWKPSYDFRYRRTK